MPETGKKWLGLVKSCIYYAHQTVKISGQILPFQRISTFPRSFEINLVNVVLCGIKDLSTSEMTIKLKKKITYIGPVNIFQIYYTANV